MPSKRELITPLLVRSGAASLLRKTLPWAGVITLNYHRIGDGSASLFDRGLWSATADQFDRQIKFAKANFDLISPADLPQVRKSARGRHCIITFDDGYLDNHHAAFPILKSNNAPATFFVTTGFIDNATLPWWDEIAWMIRSSKKSQLDLAPWIPNPVPLDDPAREGAVRTVLKAYKAMPTEKTPAYLDAIAQASASGRYAAATALPRTWMTWDHLREMHAAGMTIGGHTVNHPILGRMSEDAQCREISGCVQRLAEELKSPITAFSYPVGHTDAFNHATRACLKNAGIQHAFSYYGGIAKFNAWDDYDIRRLPIDNDLSFDHFRAIVMLPQLFGRPEFAA